jgi:predicted RND superfamily exporter protein
MRRLMGWIVDHPWWVIALVGAITLLFAAFIPGIKTEQDFREYLPEDDPAVRALEQAEERYGAQIFSIIAFEADDTVFKVSTLEKIKDLEDRIAEIPGVEEVQSPLTAQIITGTEAAITVGPSAPGGRVPESPEELAAYRDRVMGSRQLRGMFVSEDGRAAAIMFKLDPRLSTVETEEIARKVEAMAREYGGPEKIYLAGGMFEALEAQRMMMRDLQVLLPIAIVMVAVVLYLSFRSLRGVVIPLLVVCLGVIWTVGAMAVAGIPFTVISIIIPVILLAMGTADGIHIVNRYYEVAARGSPKREVVVATMDEMTSPVVMTSLTTIAGFLSLLASFLVPQRQFGVFTAVGMGALLLLSLTLVPALLSLLRLPATKTKEQQLEQGLLARGLARLGSGVVRHRAWVLAIAVVLVAISLVGVPRLRLETELSQYIGEDSPIAQTMEVMDDRFGGAMQLAIEIDTGRRDGLKDPEMLAKIVALQEFLETEPAISTTSSIADMVREMNQKFHGDDPAYYVIPEDGRLVSQLLFLFTFQGGSLGSMALGDFSAGEVFARVKGIDSTQEIEELMKRVQAYLDGNFNAHGIRAQEVGIAQVSISLLNRLVASQATSLGTSMVAVWVIVTLLMRSLLAGLISLIPLVITVALNFGFMAYTGRPLDIATMMIGSIVIGVGIDYAIHFQSRFRLEYARAKNPNPGRAIEQTMRTSGRGIVYNAVTVGLGFAVLVFSTLKGTAIFGSLIATAMGLSALAALTVIPALLATLRPQAVLRGEGGPKRSDQKKKDKEKGGRR